MALSSKVLIRELNSLQANLNIYQTLVAEGKDVEFNKEQVKYYREEVTRVRTAWLAATDSESEVVEEQAAPAAPQQPIVGATSKQPRPAQPTQNGVL